MPKSRLVGYTGSSALNARFAPIWPTLNVVTVNVPVSLHNLLTKLTVDRKIAARLLKCLENGERVYRSYRHERLVQKT